MSIQQPLGISNPLISLEQLFEGRYFRIPDYQRGYSWEIQQLKDIRKDIENLYTRDHKHYTGTIVATRSLNNEDTYDIVDGQQRLTTLIILLKVAFDLYPDIYSALNAKYVLRGEIGNVKPVLEHNEETKDFFNDVVIKGYNKNAEIKSHNCIFRAKNFFKDWLGNDPDKVRKIIEIATKQLGFLLFTPENDKEIGIMFEVINNRGKALSELEKIKNYFIYFATVNDLGSLRETIKNKWIEVQKNLSMASKTSNDDENKFLRYCYIVFYDTNKEKSWHVYDQLKERYKIKQASENITNKVIEIERFIDFIAEASLHYAYLHNANGFFANTYTGPKKKELDKVLKLLRCQPTRASILPIYLAVMSRLPSGDFTDQIVRLLNLLEVVNFRIYILPKVTNRADSKQGDMFGFANEFYHFPFWTSEEYEAEYTAHGNRLIKGDIFDWLRQQLIQITKAFCPELKFIQSLTIDEGEAENYYNWKGLRYFLGNYETHLQAQHKHSWDLDKILIGRKESVDCQNDCLSIEHIWASGNKIADFDKHHIEKRRLGNFVLIGLISNIQLNDLDIQAKVEKLVNNNTDKGLGTQILFQVSELKEFAKKAWNYYRDEMQYVRKSKNTPRLISQNINDLRETKLVEFALKRWRLPNEKFTLFKEVNSYLTQGQKEKYILNEE